MKLNINLEFDLPDDEYDYQTWNKAEQYRRVLSDFFAELRLKAKHCKEGAGSYEEVYNMLWTYMRDEDLSWEDVS